MTSPRKHLPLRYIQEQAARGRSRKRTVRTLTRKPAARRAPLSQEKPCDESAWRARACRLTGLAADPSICGADAPTSWCGFWSGDKSLRLEVGFEIVDLGFQFRSRKLPILGRLPRCGLSRFSRMALARVGLREVVRWCGIFGCSGAAGAGGKPESGAL